MALLEKIKDPSHLRQLPVDQLPELAREVRDRMLHCVSQKGGHLGSSLGATEITIALHYVFDTPKDLLVWDTGHQTYVHKMLTGRQDRFHTVRQFKGLSGFPKREESPYDTFGVGHASTSISAALGMATARDINKQTHKVVAICADGSLTGGLAFEGLQNAGHLGTDMLVVLNDNEMFISNRVGALGAFLTKLLTGGLAKRLESEVEKFLKRIQYYGAGALRVAKRLRVLLFPGMLFEEMGFAYFGPVDGHDVQKLIEVLESIKTLKGPVLLHVITKKGKGYPPAENDPAAWHGPGKFDVEKGMLIKPNTPQPITYTKAFSQTLVRLMREDRRVIAITAAMPDGTGTDAAMKEFPERYFDVGLAEQHMVTFAAGQACEGLKPVVVVYSTFLQRGWDEMVHDVGMQKLPVIFAMDRGGLVGEDGQTHHGMLDYAFSRIIPNFVVMAPKDENELQHMLNTAVHHNGPITLRYPRGSGENIPMDKDLQVLPIGKGEILREGSDGYLIGIGSMVYRCLEAAALLEKQGVSVGVVNARFVKPLDLELLGTLAKRVPSFITVEDHNLVGGFGSAVLEAKAEEGWTVAVHRVGIPDDYIEHGTQAQLHDMLGMTPEKIAAKSAEWIRADRQAFRPVAS